MCHMYQGEPAEIIIASTVKEPDDNICRPFRFHMCNDACETTAGIIFTTSESKAAELLKKHYPFTDVRKWDIEEMSISADGLYEIYYGG